MHNQALKSLQNAGFARYLGRNALNWIVKEKMAALKAHVDEAMATANG